MRTMKTCLIVGLIFMVGSWVKGAETTPPPPVSWDTTMPAIEIANQPLEKVLNQIKTQLPGFDFRIARENVPHDYPVLPNMRVENVSLTQFFNLVSQEIPGIEVDARTRGFSNFNEPNPNTQIVCYLTVKPNPNSVAPDADVHVFGLAEIIAYRASLISGDGDHTKQASDDVLSLIQASLHEQNITPKAEMKLHPATQVLICHVTSAQEELIKQVLAALRPSEAEQHKLVADDQAKATMIQALKDELKEAGGEASQNPRAITLRARLAELDHDSTTQPEK